MQIMSNAQLATAEKLLAEAGGDVRVMQRAIADAAGPDGIAPAMAAVIARIRELRAEAASISRPAA